jgi:ABC-type phosphate transport system substrate-binding protein
MKTTIKIMLAIGLLALCGCQTLTINIGSNNQLFNTRSQATGSGSQEALVEGGGSPTVSPTVSVVP